MTLYWKWLIDFVDGGRLYLIKYRKGWWVTILIGHVRFLVSSVSAKKRWPDAITSPVLVSSLTSIKMWKFKAR